DLGNRLRGTGENPWDEYGTTTGRPRRTGWLDAVILRYAARVNGLTEMMITKLDILSGFAELMVATEYTVNGQATRHMPSELDTFATAQPVYETMPGWSKDITTAREFEALPSAAQHYVERIEALAGVPVKLITVGPGREQSIEKKVASSG